MHKIFCTKGKTVTGFPVNTLWERVAHSPQVKLTVNPDGKLHGTSRSKLHRKISYLFFFRRVIARAQECRRKFHDGEGKKERVGADGVCRILRREIFTS